MIPPPQPVLATRTPEKVRRKMDLRVVADLITGDVPVRNECVVGI